MEKNKVVINILLIIIIALVICACVLGYFYFTKDKTKPILNPSERKEAQNQEQIFTEESYPKIDGSTVTLSLAEAFKSNFTKTDIKEVEVTHTTTNNAYINLINGETDLILVPYPSEEEYALAEEKGVELEIQPIAKDALVFFVNKDNKVNNLALEQVQDIYSGNIKNWRDVGGENERIKPFQKPENTESQKGMQTIVMQGKKMIEPLTETLTEREENIINVVSDYDNSKDAIGYSFYYYANTMYNLNEMKLLTIDGIEPTYDNIQTGLYGLQTTYYAIIKRDEAQDSNVRKLLEAMKSERGQIVVKEAGYVQNY